LLWLRFHFWSCESSITAGAFFVSHFVGKNDLKETDLIRFVPDGIQQLHQKRHGHLSKYGNIYWLPDSDTIARHLLEDYGWKSETFGHSWRQISSISRLAENQVNKKTPTVVGAVIGYRSEHYHWIECCL
jgi:hypothetical protein